MKHSQAYQSCCVCTHSFTPGLAKACDFDGFRRFLAVNSRGRMRRIRSNGQTYEFSEVERRPLPQHRDNKFVRECLQAGRQLRMNLLGHKHAPLIAKWPGFDWWRINVPELMHDSKIFTEMLLKILVGKGSDGMYKYWSLDKEHRAQSEARGVFKSIWIQSSGANAPLPWFVGRDNRHSCIDLKQITHHSHPLTLKHHNRRLTKEQINMLDGRMSNTVWPHYIDRMYYKGYSFWKRPNRIWKMIRKVRLLYYILPTQLRGVVPAVRHALRTFVWAMRRLEGQVYSYDEAVRINLVPGSRAVDKAEIAKMHRDLVLGLVLFEGCLPAMHLNPGMHHFVHYAEYVRTHGPLRIFWMMAFERLVLSCMHFIFTFYCHIYLLC